MDLFLTFTTVFLLNLHHVSACGDNYTELTGTFTSPDYGSKSLYPPNSDCEWTISTPEGTNIVLIFIHFDLDCSDSISVTDVSNSTEMQITDNQCKLKKEIYFLSNKILIHFVSDGNSEREGFKIKWTVKSVLSWHSDFATVHEAHETCRRQGGGLVKDIALYEGEIIKMMQERFVTSIWQSKNTYVTPWVWIKGCFNFPNYDDLDTFVTLKNNTMAGCQRHCKRWNYFGLQKDKCFCIDSYAGPPVLMDHYCTIPCSGNNEERCGGNRSLTIYMNDVCYKDISSWQGTISRTKEGNICLPWNNISAVVQDNTAVFPDGSAQNASNFCRIPNSSEALWCYVSQNRTELCDVPQCFDIEGSDEFNCIRVEKLNSGAIKFNTRSCIGKDRAICYGVGEDGYVIDSRESWATHRQKIWRGSESECKSLVGPSFFFMDKKKMRSNGDNYYFIGLYRSSITNTEIYPEMDKHTCITIEVKDNQISKKEIDCSSKRLFICQTGPVTCGGNYDGLSNNSFSTPGFPSGYGPLTRCEWTIHVPDGYIIMLTIDVDIEDSYQCRNDYLNIYFGTSTNDNLNSTLCGRVVKEFDNIRTDVRLEFFADDSKNSHGITVFWLPVPISTSPTTETTTTIDTTTITEGFSKQVYVEDNVGLSNGAFAGIIVAVVILLVLSCLGGYLFGTRRRSSQQKDNATSNDEVVNSAGYMNTGVSATPSSDISDHGYSTTKSFLNERYEEGPADNVPKDSRQNLDRDGAEIRANNLAIYSVVNKSKTGKFSPHDNNSALEMESLENKPDLTYNHLNEKIGMEQDKMSANVYNCMQVDEDSFYNNTVLPSRNIDRNDVTPRIDTYDHKKNGE